LWTLLTLGMYLPWARVRSQRYLMRHTQVAGHVLDYHEPPTHLLPRYLMGLGLLLGVAGAWAGGSMLAGMLALSLALAVWPLFVFMSLTHRMAHISWAHRRLAFDASCQAVYRAMWRPLVGGAAVAWVFMAAAILRHPGSWVAWGVAVSLWVLAMPAFVWTWYLFRQRHLRLGPMHLLWKASRAAVAMMFLRITVWAMLTTIFSLGVAAMVLAGVLVMRGRLAMSGVAVHGRAGRVCSGAALCPGAPAEPGVEQVRQPLPALSQQAVHRRLRAAAVQTRRVAGADTGLVLALGRDRHAPHAHPGAHGVVAGGCRRAQSALACPRARCAR
jgi:uncharacterized membrane protein YjgN (DUF898 family)